MSDGSLVRSTPEEQGLASGAILAFIDAVQEQIDSLHSFVLLRHGRLVSEGWWSPYEPDGRQLLFSVSKSFTATAVGLAVAEGLLSVDDRVLSFFPDAASTVVDERLAAMRVRDLLTMTTGHREDTVALLGLRADGDWVRAFLELPVEYQPGTRFVYNSGASYLLSAIVQRRAGVTMLEYLRPRLFEPLGIMDVSWPGCPRGVTVGGWGLSLRTRETARLGQLYLDDGVWNGRRLLERGWVRAATSRQVANDGRDAPVDWEQGYGYQFWRCRHGAYRADGAFGQFCVALPEQDAVLAVTGGVADMQAVLDLVWKHLVPGMASGPLAEDVSARERLDARLSGLRLQPASGAAPRSAAAVSGRGYQVTNPQPAPVEPSPLRGPSSRIEGFTLSQRPDGWWVALRDEHGTHELACGDGVWRRGVSRLGGEGEIPVAVSGGRREASCFVMRVCFYETPFIRTFTWRFDGAEAVLSVQDNVSFEPTSHPLIQAHVVG